MPNEFVKDRTIAYYGLGFNLIPLKSKDKTPAIPWKRYQQNRVEASELRKWLNNEKANYNFGIVAGNVSGVVIVDADSPEASAWCHENLPSTPMRTKTKKGEHLYFKHPGVKVPNGVKLKGLALDVRGDGGYVVAPGSTHPSGFVYEEHGDWSSIENLPIFDPAWLANSVSEQHGLDDKIRRYIQNAPDSTEGKNGSATLMSVVSKLIRGFGLSRDQALPYLAEYNHLHAKPEWSEQELQHALDSVQNTPGSRGNASRTEDGGIQALLLVDAKKRISPFQANIEVLLVHHPDLVGTISMCEFSHQIRKLRSMPWGGNPGDSWTDRDDVEFKSWIETNYRWSPKENLIQGALLTVAHRNPSHPVREYLNGLNWDGASRIGIWTSIYLGVKDEPYSRLVGRILLIQAVARVYKPGCKADHIVILEGPQGLKKSTAIRTLVPYSDWFEDSMPDFRNKDGLMALLGKWLIEFQELHSMSRADSSHTKAFITDQEDTFRAPYGRRIQTCKRQCVFIGTTNEKVYLPDSTGNRRFLPLECTAIDIDALLHDRDQLWAEAVHAFNRGEVWHLTAIDAALATDSQELRRIEDPWEPIIGKYLDGKCTVTLAEVMKHGLELIHQNCKSSEAYRVSRIISGVFGWRKTKVLRGKPEARVNGFESNPVQPP